MVDSESPAIAPRTTTTTTKTTTSEEVEHSSFMGSDDELEEDEEASEETPKYSSAGAKGGVGSAAEDKRLRTVICALSRDQRLTECERYKGLGTAAFRENNYREGLESYSMALKHIVFAKDDASDSKASSSSSQPTKPKHCDVPEDQKQFQQQNKDGEAMPSQTKQCADQPDQEEEFKARERDLQISCELNVCMCHLKLGEWFSAIQAANNVLDMAPNNIKALYRRGLSRSNFGELDRARRDLLKVLELDSENLEARQELINIKNKIKQQRQTDKKAFGNIFGSNAASLYDDKEKERQQRLFEEDEKRKQRREEWHKAMNARQEAGEEEVGFEEWCQQDEREKQKKEEEEEEARKAKQKAAYENKPKANTDHTKLEEDAFDEEEQRILRETKKMGYCYFRRDLTDDERRLNALNKPQKLESATANSTAGTASTATESPAPLPAIPGSPPALSSWNAKGTTYEEKDMTAWCIEQFTAKLKAAETSSKPDFSDPSQFMKLLQDLPLAKGDAEANPMAAVAKLTERLYSLSLKTEEVKNVGGEGHISVISGSRRFLFDLHATVVWCLTIDTTLPNTLAPPAMMNAGAAHQYRGELVIRDVSSALPADCNWLSDSRVVYYDKVKSEHKHICTKLMEDFQAAVIKQIDKFLAEYRSTS